MKTGWQTAFILTVGLGATAIFYGIAVLPVHPVVEVGSGKLLTPPLSAQEQYFLTFTGSGTLRTEVKDERTYLEMLFAHAEKGLSLTQYMAENSQDEEVRLTADSMARRYRFDLLQMRVWLKQWYDEEKPLPGAHPLPLEVDKMEAAMAQRTFIDYMIRQHGWSSAMTRVALEKNLRPEMADFARQRLRIDALDVGVLTQLQKRF